MPQKQRVLHNISIMESPGGLNVFAFGYAARSDYSRENFARKKCNSTHQVGTKICKPSLSLSATIHSNACVMEQSPEHIPILMSSALAKAKAHPVPSSFVPLLGLAYDVMTRLKNVKSKELTQLPDALKVGFNIHNAPSGSH